MFERSDVVTLSRQLFRQLTSDFTWLVETGLSGWKGVMFVKTANKVEGMGELTNSLNDCPKVSYLFISPNSPTVRE